MDGGITPSDAVDIAKAFKAAGADMMDCSSGQVSKLEKPVYGRMFQTPFADRIRQEAGIPTIAVGAISEADHANSILAAGRADLCAVARPHLANPAWTLTEAAKIGYTPVVWPKQYRSAKGQMESLFAREKAAQAPAASLGHRHDPHVEQHRSTVRPRHALVTGGGASVQPSPTAGAPRHARHSARAPLATGQVLAAEPPDLLHAVAADVANASEVAAAFADAVVRFGRVDVLVNNAGQRRAFSRWTKCSGAACWT